VTKRRLLHFGTAPVATGSHSGVDIPAAPVAGPGGGIPRRAFLVRSSLAAGAAAALGSVPGLGGLLSSTEADSSSLDGAASGAAGGPVAEAGAEVSPPLVAHVINATTGEMSLYQGTTQIVTKSPALAQAIARLAASKS